METAELTVLTGPSVSFLISMIILIFVLPRRCALAPLLMTVLTMTIGQQIVIGGANFTFLRIVILAGWARVLAKGEFDQQCNTKIDKAFMCWVIAAVIIGLIPKAHHPDAIMPERGFVVEIINKAGFAFDALGGYFLARLLLRTRDDVLSAIYLLVGLSVVLTLFMTLEKLTGRNLFSIFGAVPEFTAIRDGRLRCQGPFTHPIHAGNFGATLLPLAASLWFYEKRLTAAVGMLAGTMVTMMSASSGPLMVWFSALVGLALWRFRNRMMWVRRGIVVILVSLEIIMKSHFWWIIARIGDLVGGGSYWRAKLIDQFVFHFSEWWLRGTNYTAHWSPTGVGLPLYPDLMDLTNQFVAEGVNGGLLRLILFIIVIVMCFKKIGRIVTDCNLYSLSDRFLFWTFGSALVAYIFAFISVSASAQTAMLYYCLLAFVSCQPLLKK